MVNFQPSFSQQTQICMTEYYCTAKRFGSKFERTLDCQTPPSMQFIVIINFLHLSQMHLTAFNSWRQKLVTKKALSLFKHYTVNIAVYTMNIAHLRGVVRHKVSRVKLSYTHSVAALASGANPQ